MIDKSEETVHDIKSPRLNNLEGYVLTHNRFNTYMVLIFSDLDKTQIYKIPYRDNPHHETELVISFNILSVFKPNEHTEDYHIRKSSNRN